MQITNDKQTQEDPSKGSCLTQGTHVVALVWTDYTPRKKRGAAGPLGEQLEMPLME